jgi:tetratricopeptide (TPR) repeat protein
MKMRKIGLFVMAALLAGQTLMAQSLGDGLKFFYYDRWTSAKNVFEKLVTANPADADATYWLGQVLIKKSKVADAKALYQKALQASPNAALLMVGMGQITMLEGGSVDLAKNQFEAALNLTKNKKGNDPKILMAVGRANAFGESKIGDQAYAISKLQEAATLLPLDPEPLELMGTCYLKQSAGDGGNAVTKWMEAKTRSPQYARAEYRIGKVYLSQNNTEIFLQKFNNAITMDPTFAPAYLELFDYYKYRDVNKAKDYLDKYLMNTDESCETKFFNAEYRFRAGKYQESLDLAKAMESACGAEFPRLDLLFAFDYDRLGDTVTSKASMDKFIAKEDPSKIVTESYLFASKVYSRFGDSTAFLMFDRAAQYDTSAKNKLVIVDSAARTAGRMGNQKMQQKYLIQKLSMKKEPTAYDFYAPANLSKQMKDYVMADTLYAQYATKFPTDLVPLRQRVSIAELQDTTMEKGLALPHWLRLYDAYMVHPDKMTKYVPNIVELCAKIAAYKYNIQKNKTEAVQWFDKGLEVDPANVQLKQYKEALSKPAPAPPKTTPKTKPTTTKGGKGGKK